MKRRRLFSFYFLLFTFYLSRLTFNVYEFRFDLAVSVSYRPNRLRKNSVDAKTWLEVSVRC